MSIKNEIPEQCRDCAKLPECLKLDCIKEAVCRSKVRSPKLYAEIQGEIRRE